MATNDEIKKLEKLKKKYIEAREVYEDLAVEYYRTHYNTDKEYKALWDARVAYNNIYDEYILAKLGSHNRDKKNTKKEG